jgi:hypothetical protein
LLENSFSILCTPCELWPEFNLVSLRIIISMLLFTRAVTFLIWIFPGFETFNELTFCIPILRPNKPSMSPSAKEFCYACRFSFFYMFLILFMSRLRSFPAEFQRSFQRYRRQSPAEQACRWSLPCSPATAHRAAVWIFPVLLDAANIYGCIFMSSSYMRQQIYMSPELY